MSKTALPLATRSSIELLSFGTRIAFHHRAGVARHKKLHADLDDKGWIIVQGCSTREVVYENDDFPFNTVSQKVHDLGYSDRKKHMFFNWPKASSNYGQHCNKTVFVWSEDGFGWIIGVIRKSIGVSSPGYRSRSWDGDDYEPGYHHTDMYVDLYVIKQWYEGTDYILCPLWAVSGVEDD